MNKLISLKLDGSLTTGFQVTAEINDNQSLLIEERGSLPPAPLLIKSYQSWCNSYRSLDGNSRIKIKNGVRNVQLYSLKEQCQENAKILSQNFYDWLQFEEFRTIKEKCLSQLIPDEPVRVIIRSEDPEVRKLPWYLWDICQNHPDAEVALSGLTAQRIKRSYRPNVRILIVLGNSEGIQVAEDEKLLKQYCSSGEKVFLVEPSRQELNEYLWDKQGWDILFFSGHSQTEGNSGRIFLNQNDSLTLDELRYGLQTAVQQGLQIAFFNSCDGLGLAAELESLHIPQVIVMREPVPDKVAQEFLKYFLAEFTGGTSLYQAVGIARKKLQAWEHEYPCASWLPVIIQNFLEVPPTWQSLGAIFRCPYRGLAAFREEDAPDFYGREEFTQQLVMAVKQKSFVAVIGASGSGKSSVVFAGLIPYLKKSHEWRVVTFRPGNNPFESLAVALMAAGIARSAETDSQQRRFAELELEVELREGTRTLENIIANFNATSRRSHILLVADQFEELYTQCADAQERLCFLDNLLNAVHNAPLFTLVLTLRADFYSYALSYRPLADALHNAQFNLAPMTAQELHSAIEVPAANMGVQLEKGLSDRLLSSVLNSPNHLPLLQFALSQLWEQQQQGYLTHNAYDDIGGLDQALANYAESIYAQLNDQDRAKAQQIFLQLIQPQEEAEDTRRLAKRDEVGVENWDLVTRLAASRLVVTNRNHITNVESVEIIHETLIKNWQRLQQWLQLDREFRRWQEQLRAAIRQWENSDKDEEALLRGKTLAIAEDWLQQRFEQISLSEQLFINLSLELRDREHKQKERFRQLTITGLTAGLFVTLTWLAIVAWQWQQAEFQRQLAQNNELKVLTVSARELFKSNQQIKALKTILTAVAQVNRTSNVKSETKTLLSTTLEEIIDNIQEQNSLEKHNDIVSSIAFSPGNQFIASGSYDDTIKIWQRNGKLLQTLPLKGSVFSVSFANNGKILAAASHDNKINLWRYNPQTNLFESYSFISIADSDRLSAFSLSPNGKIVVTGDKKGTIKLWNTSGEMIKSFSGHSSLIESVSFSPNGNTIATGSRDKTLKLWNLEGKLLKTFQGDDAILSIAFSPNGQLLASGSKDNKVKLWKLDGKLLQTFEGHSGQVLHVAFSPDSKFIASASMDKTVKLWRVGNKKAISTFQGHKDVVLEVSFSSDGKTLASASVDKTIKLWNLNNIQPIYLQGTSVSFSRDGQMLALGSLDGKITLIHNESQLQRTFPGHTQEIIQLSFTADNKTLVTVDVGNHLKFWSVDGRLQGSNNQTGWLSNLGNADNFNKVVNSTTRFSLSPDGETIATAGTDNIVRVWSIKGKLLNTVQGHQDKILSLNFSPDGKILATSSADKTVKLWSRDGKLLHTLQGHQAEVLDVSFSPDNKVLATASVDKIVKLWSRDGKLLQTLQHSGGINSVSFSPDSQVVATASDDKVVYLWSVQGEQLQALTGHKEEVLDVSFSPDGLAIASTDNNNNVIIWDLDLKEMQKRGCAWLRDYFATHQNFGESQADICSEQN
ncbi:MAG TPA: CHAT domain-containing protein [Oculatellaceae cyanobacterium]|jgi:WD40 repeat protein/energy-coupling factor transporter ATP-binding protein EcfA2